LLPVKRADKSGPIEGLLRGTFGAPPITIDRQTRRIDDAVLWQASVESPARCSDDHEVYLRGLGDIAQKAIDGLAERLTDLAQWAYSALHPGEEELHYAADPRDATACNAVGVMRYTDDLVLFESLIGIVPTCEECVAQRHAYGEDDQE
jgi:hypothetical protein